METGGSPSLRRARRAASTLAAVAVALVSGAARADDPPAARQALPEPAGTGVVQPVLQQYAAPGSAWAPGQAPFEFAGANQIALRRTAADQRTGVYALAIVAAPRPDLRAWMPVVLATVRDGSLQTTADGAVVPRLLPGDASHPAQLQLTVEFTRLGGPGTYEVTIGLFPVASPPRGRAGGAGSAASAPDPGASDLPRLTVKLVVPVAQLRAPAAVHIDRFVPVFGDPVDAPRAFTLYETGKDTPAEIAVRRDGELTADDHPIGAELELSDSSPGAAAGSAPRAIPAGGASVIGLRVTGDVPVGTSRGTLLISAPELPAAISVPIEIRTHRSTAWIPLLFVVGTLLGLVWRQASQRRKQQLESEARVQDLCDQITELKRGYPTQWATDLAALETARDAIRASREPNEATITAAEQALAAALGKRVDRRATLLARLAEAREASVARRVLPPGIAIEPLAYDFQAAHDEAVADHIARSLDLAARARDQLEVIVNAAQVWARELAAILEPVKAAVPGCPLSARGPVAAAIRNAIDSAAKLDSIPRVGPVDADAPLGPRLDLLQAARLDADAAARALVDGLAATRHALAAPGIAPSARDALRAASAVAVVPGRPERTIASAIAASGKLAAAVAVELTRLHAGDCPAEPAALLAAGDYAAALTWRPAPSPRTKAMPGSPTSARLRHESRDDAVDAVDAVDAERGALDPADGTEDDLVGFAHRRQPGGAGAARELDPSPSRLRPRPPRRGPALPRYVPVLERPPRSSAAIRRELAWWVRLAWATSALVASGTAWALYAGNFAGTTFEMFGLFAFGFATDLATGNKLEELIGKIKLPGQP